MHTRIIQWVRAGQILWRSCLNDWYFGIGFSPWSVSTSIKTKCGWAQLQFYRSSKPLNASKISSVQIWMTGQSQKRNSCTSRKKGKCDFQCFLENLLAKPQEFTTTERKGFLEPLLSWNKTLYIFTRMILKVDCWSGEACFSRSANCKLRHQGFLTLNYKHYNCIFWTHNSKSWWN